VTSAEVIEDWREWIQEAHAIVSRWEREARDGQVLRTTEAVILAERIARALHREYLRGQAESSTA
jgi:hypothetical protein